MKRVGRQVSSQASGGVRGSADPLSRLAGIASLVASALILGACVSGGTSESSATLDTSEQGEADAEEPGADQTAAGADSTPDESVVGEPETTFAQLASEADFVLGPEPLDDQRQFAVLGHQTTPNGRDRGSLELVVEAADGNWKSKQTVVGDGTLNSISAPADLDNNGLADIQSDWFVGANTDYGLMYSVDPDRVRLKEVKFLRRDLNQPMQDYSIISVEPGFVTTSVESCDPDCATGGTYNVTWRYDPATDRLVVHSQPDAPPPETTTPPDPLRISPGVIEDGVHYGYLVSAGSGAFSFDKAEPLSDGSWKNENPKVRTLPYSGSVPWSSGTPIEVRIQNQHVTSVNATSPPAPSDPLLIPPGVIEDGYHVGYLVNQGPGWISFDKAEILSNGLWENVNPKVRTLPVPYSIAAANGSPIELYVENQRVQYAGPYGG